MHSNEGVGEALELQRKFCETDSSLGFGNSSCLERPLGNCLNLHDERRPPKSPPYHLLASSDQLSFFFSKNLMLSLKAMENSSEKSHSDGP